MSRIQIISDVHTEFHRDYGVNFCQNLPIIAGILVIAGDFATESNISKCISILAKRVENIVYVCGNHEYYNSSRSKIHKVLNELCVEFKNFHWLNNNSVVINKQRFIGATLWFKNSPENLIYENRMSDFSIIEDLRNWVYEENEKTINYFKEEIRQGDVVITHHSPSDLSINDDYKDNQLNRFFVCDLNDLIKEKKPLFWIHGHMHDAVSYDLYDTRIESNPFGYLGYERTPHVKNYVKILETSDAEGRTYQKE
jgi:Icc-related predicted phosphoesterase